MSFENLSERERKILKVLIDHYVLTAEPVASRAIAKKYGLKLSPATVRNTIKDLEEIGLVSQPHTSAGRVPTTEGYRIYVNYLLQPDEPSEPDQQMISDFLSGALSGIDQILEQTSRVLGSVSSQLGITIAPQFESGIITRLELIPVAERRVLVVLAMKSGLAKTVLLEVETELKDIGLRETASILNERLCGLSIGELKRTIKRRLAEPTRGNPQLIKMFIESSDELLSFSGERDIHFGGTSYLMNQPEFNDPGKMRELLNLLDRRETVGRLMSEASGVEGIRVVIGVDSEEKSDEIGRTAELSILSSTYTAGKFKGVLGIMGPTRMPYSRLIGIVDFTAKRLSQILSE
ncbi:MAG: heat-inducible transcription repressor HrcA [Candidatus Zixiibacteriota bacterium]|nr:MAG: heat-inducible transcription repressor HrcA [candidate division Zixibacteria bacterium]